MNVPVTKGGNRVNIPVDAVIMPKASKVGDLPIFLEAKSAGDFTSSTGATKVGYPLYRDGFISGVP